MQQTETYKLNLIETSDPFSPAALNENAEKTEAALTAAAAERAAGDDALEQRVTVLELKKVVVGSYTGTGYSVYQTIDLGFPVAGVLISTNNVGSGSYIHCIMGLPGQDLNASSGGVGRINDTGFTVVCTLNDTGKRFNYIAIG